MNSDFIKKFINERNKFNYTREDTLDFLNSIKNTDSYIAGEYIVQILHDFKKKTNMNIFIHHNKVSSFIVLNINNINDISLYFERFNNNIFSYIKVIDKNNFKYKITIVPDSIKIKDYIIKKSIFTISEVWFYKNKLESTNLELIKENKCILKDEYLNDFIDNLDKKIISYIKKYQKLNFDIIIDTTNYVKKEMEEKKINIEESSILSYLVNFYNTQSIISKHKYTDGLIEYPDNIIKIFTLKNKEKLLNNMHYILFVTNNNNYSIKNLISNFNNAYKMDIDNIISNIHELKKIEEANLQSYFTKAKAEKKIKFLDYLLKKIEKKSLTDTI